ncbi:hypothetical protein [Anabaena sp. UHCC 0399]|uniref:hypothetical protein n=1 Tax=Anabaena sp. UHCC 0399 TaxID=3110238 RepID=UPI002B1FFEC1|nr:hypothetical protein [Anabaena sp. UHCC 0399]MEA5566693.1 hypothetical protein [Anabaena sp. UHCC 0399]
MAKGFGVKAEEQLGYALLLVPEVKAYAARLSIDYFPKNDDGDDEEFIGMTSLLQEAQIWKSLKEAKKAIDKYADFLISEAENNSPIRVVIRRVKRQSNGELVDEPVESIFLVAQSNT